MSEKKPGFETPKQEWESYSAMRIASRKASVQPLTARNSAIVSLNTSLPNIKKPKENTPSTIAIE